MAGTTVGKLNALLTADTSQFDSALAKAGSKAPGIGGGVLGDLGGILSGGAVLGFLTKSIEASNEAFAAQQKLEVALMATGNTSGFTAEQLSTYADALARTTGISDEVIRSAEAQLVSFGNISGEILQRAIPAVLDLAKFTASDATSAAIKLGKALSDPADALTALTKAGIVFTDSEKKAIKAMVEAGDVAGAQSAIIDKLGRSFGGAAERMATGTDHLKHSIGELEEAVGRSVTAGGIIGNLTSLVDTTTTLMDKFTGIMSTKWATPFKAQMDIFTGAFQIDLLKKIVGIGDDIGSFLSRIAHANPFTGFGDRGGAGAAMVPAGDMVKGPPQSAIDAMEEFNKKLEHQRDTFGMSADAIRIYDLKQQGMSDEALEATRNLLAEKDALEANAQAARTAATAQQAMQTAITSTIHGLEDQSATLGMSAAGIAAWQLQQQGASEVTVEYARSLAESNEYMRKFLQDATTLTSTDVSGAIAEAAVDLQRLNDAFEAGTVNLDAYNESVGKLQDALDKTLKDAGERLHERLMTPAEKAEREIDNLQALLDAKAIDMEDYRRGLVDIQKQLTGGDAGGMGSSNPALEFGTAAAYSASGSDMRNAFSELIRNDNANAEHEHRILDEISRKLDTRWVVKEF